MNENEQKSNNVSTSEMNEMLISDILNVDKVELELSNLIYSGNYSIYNPNKKLIWNPQEDITTFELAQCIPLILMSQYGPINESFIDLKQPYMRNFKID